MHEFIYIEHHNMWYGENMQLRKCYIIEIYMYN